MGGDGPLVGRADELDRLVSCLAAGSGVTVEGPPGVGKSRVIAAATARLSTSGGCHVVQVAATTASMPVPLGALATHLMGAPPGADDLARLEHSMLEAAQGRPILFVVDDAHLLDDLSAVVLHQLALAGHARVLAAVRTGEPVSSAVDALSKDGLSEHLVLPLLDEDDVAALAACALDGPVDAQLAGEVWAASRGNPMVALVLLRSGVRTGTVVRRHGLWTSDGPLTADPRLLDLIGDRLAELAPAEREALEIIALTEPLDAVLVERLVPPKVLAVLTERGLVRGPDGPLGARFRLAHPVYGDAVRLAMSGERRQAVVADLAAVLDAAGPLEAEMLLRVAVWGAAAECALDADLLVRAAAVARTRSLESAAHLLRAALGAGAPAAVALELAEVLTFAGRPADAADVLTGFDRASLSPADQVVAAATTATGLTWTLQLPDEALAVLAEARAHGIDEPVLRAVLDAAEGAAHLVRGDVRAAERAATRSLDVHGSPDEVAVQGATVATVAAAYQGRTGDALATARRWDGARERVAAAAPVLSAGLLGARWSALELAGDLATLRAEAEVAWRRAVDGDDDHVRARAAQALARVALLAARPRRAAGLLRQVLVSLSPFDRMFAPWNLALLAEASAVAGDVAGGREALERCDEPGPIAPIFAADRSRAEAALLAAEGHLSRASDVAASGARHAAAFGSLGVAARCWIDAARFGRPPGDEMVEVLTEVDGALGPAALQLATASAAHDGPALDAAAGALAGIGAGLFAAEAAAAAARVHRRAGRTREASASIEHARSLLDGDDPVCTPGLCDLDAGGAPLTPREREVALLAAGGLADRSIAEMLGVSVRTVETHLGRSYAKLGVEGRKALADVFDVAANADPAPPA